MEKTPRPRVLVVLLALIPAALLSVAPSAARATHHRHRARASRACVDANRSAASAPRSAMKAAVLCLINEQRLARHLPALDASDRLNRSAQGWTDAMVRFGMFTHGSSFASRISAVGVNWSSVGENLATGISTPRQVVNAWMASPDHCRNILSPTFRDGGTGVDGRPVRGFASRGATWSEDFALPMGQRSPSGNWGPASGCPY